MKKFYLMMLAALLAGQLLTAQNSGRGFNYQAIARDINGQVLQNEMVILQFGLYAGQTVTEPAWQELQVATTDEFGAFSLTVGHGQKSGGTLNSYEDLDYAAADYWLKVELKDGSEFYEISFRELLSVPYAEVARNATLFSPGMIIPYAGTLNSIPDGWLLCDGTLVDKNTYPALYAALGNSWGGTTTHFRLPDARGMFLRGVAYGSGNDPDRGSRTASAAGGNTGDNVGSKQGNEFKNHTHTGNTGYAGEHRHYSGVIVGIANDYSAYAREGTYGTASGGNRAAEQGSSGVRDRAVTNTIEDHRHSFTSNSTGGAESRPENIYVNYIIKY